jgi:hypothetical protein
MIIWLPPNVGGRAALMEVVATYATLAERGRRGRHRRHHCAYDRSMAVGAARPTLHYREPVGLQQATSNNDVFFVELIAGASRR